MLTPEDIALPDPTVSAGGAGTMSDGTVAVIGVLVVGAIGVGVWMWNKDQDRLAKLSPEARHQENMDRLAAGAVYGLFSTINNRDR